MSKLREPEIQLESRRSSNACWSQLCVTLFERLKIGNNTKLWRFKGIVEISFRFNLGLLFSPEIISWSDHVAVFDCQLTAPFSIGFDLKPVNLEETLRTMGEIGKAFQELYFKCARISCVTR
jgi:hypothetical protein